MIRWLAACVLLTLDARAEVHLLVSAAASLRPALESLAPVFQTNHPGTTVTFNFGASGSLANQIDAGAPVDVFLSAGRKPIDTLIARGRLDTNTLVTLVRNTLVLVAPTNRPAPVLERLDAPAVRQIALGEPGSVPAGQYAAETLRSLGLWDKLPGRLVFAKDVRQVLTYVEKGEVDAGFVYASDLAPALRVTVVTRIDPRLHAPIVYPAAVITDAPHPTQARAYLEFLRTPPARATFEAHGFLPP